MRRGKGGRRREVGMDDWAWEQPQRTAADLVAFARRVDPAARGLTAPTA